MVILSYIDAMWFWIEERSSPVGASSGDRVSTASPGVPLKATFSLRKQNEQARTVFLTERRANEIWYTRLEYAECPTNNCPAKRRPKRLQLLRNDNRDARHRSSATPSAFFVDPGDHDCRRAITVNVLGSVSPDSCS